MNNGLVYGKYTFSCSFNGPAILPEFKGSTFRGVFGHALKRVVCALKQQECKSCPINGTCLYVQVFEGDLKPHPFVLEPPVTRKRVFESGDRIDFDLILFGKLNDQLPYFVYAIERIGRIGIGRKINGKRGGFLLEDVRAGGKSIYSPASGAISLNKHTTEILNVSNNGSSSRRVRVEMITPLRLKFKNSLWSELEFHILVRAVLRRISSLFEAYAGGEPLLDYKGLVSKAMEIKTVRRELRWFDWERYSNRQKSRMRLGGVVGFAEFEGDLGEFIPFLELGSALHLGKNTAFGLGKIIFSETNKISNNERRGDET